VVTVAGFILDPPTGYKMNLWKIAFHSQN
jgi:hypothetical protein